MEIIFIQNDKLMNLFKENTKRLPLFLLSFVLSLYLSGQHADQGPVVLSDTDQKSFPTEMEDAKNDEQNKVRIVGLLFSGVLIQQPTAKRIWYIPNLFDLFPANTIEGFVGNLKVSMTQYLQHGRFLRLTPELRYGFGNNRLRARLAGEYYYHPASKASLQLAGGRFVEQINEESTLNALNNTYYTFLLKRNFLKLYEKSYLEIRHIFSPAKDFLFTNTVSWNERSPLQNLPAYSDGKDKYTANDPVNNELADTGFERHRALLWETQLRWQWGHQYSRQKGKFVSSSPYPAVTISYQAALAGVLGSVLSYQKLNLQITDQFKWNKVGSGNLSFEVGDFMAKDNLTFLDYKHFDGKRTVYGVFNPLGFELLDYYESSTANFYLQGHYEQHLNAIPIRNKKLYPVFSANYLYTETGGSYWELGVGVEKILGFWRIDLYNSWREVRHESIGIRLGINLAG